MDTETPQCFRHQTRGKQVRTAINRLAIWSMKKLMKSQEKKDARRGSSTDFKQPLKVI